MPGFQSKKLVTDRYADPVTIDHIIALRKKIEQLQELLEEMVRVWMEGTVTEMNNSVEKARAELEHKQ